MTPKPVVLRRRARHDIDEAIDHYSTVATSALALAFIDALEETFRRVAEHTASGSPRYADELALPGLRSCVVKGFPYLLFYVEREADIDVWRILHAARDIPTWLQEPPNN
ncbi:MAG: type II toxin-antitoxin system RelE/ParE family toxin [Chloroflexota bacterium]|nr:type II toxin-antitoxin system RelE/ParE family toxin [Chloroflexota bacterium]MDE2898060.1 type II toxin-antitoxin system RelE/ParE family toxin [Chloroflexota bacterium]MDE2904348.1 type II toxin-antitoxin system RelE/ParE family toxin [Chloroflexota bacterium]MDE2920003.1 type II toxin-antitoxin system RelE/ParE family toxin [Chloroflexota bacterium]